MEPNVLASLKEHELNLSDFALFLSVMKNPRAYRSTLSIIMDEPDIELSEVKVEQVILNKSGKRAIRLDAWAKSTDNRQFNMEMQNDSKNDNLAKRSRYYQGLIRLCKNGSPVLVSMLQYMKKTQIDNPEIIVKDPRIVELDHVVTEVRKSEEWEAVQMNLLEIGMAEGAKRKLVEQVQKKLTKGYTAQEIADILEESLETIEEIIKELE